MRKDNLRFAVRWLAVVALVMLGAHLVVSEQNDFKAKFRAACTELGGTVVHNGRERVCLR